MYTDVVNIIFVLRVGLRKSKVTFRNACFFFRLFVIIHLPFVAARYEELFAIKATQIPTNILSVTIWKRADGL
jgi:hypothetical protein